VKRRGGAAAPRRTDVEQLGIGFEGVEVVEPPIAEPAPDTMRQIVSLRMPDALMDRVEEAAQRRGVSPSSLMRAFIAAGLDRSYAAVRDPSDLAGELAELRQLVERLAASLEVTPVVDSDADGPSPA
jgi:hypothetical protein